MKITEKELREMVQEALQKKTLEEGADFTAKRQIIHSAQNASMNFETEIVNLLNLAKPDDMPPHVQKAYFKVVKAMEENIVRAVSEAVQKLSGYPRNDGGDK